MTNQATRLIVKAAGDLAPEVVASISSSDTIFESTDFSDSNESEKTALQDDIEDEVQIDIEKYRPTILEDRSWTLSELDLGEKLYLCALGPLTAKN